MKSLAGAGESPQTLLHGDFRLDNFMFGTAEDSFDLALVDWQLCNTGNGMCDVAYFISGAIGPDGRREQECQLLDVYYSTLVANGVENYTKESCIRDYKLALLDRIPFRVIAWGLLDFSNARGRRLIEVTLSRFSPALIENNVEEMIPRD